MRREPFALVLDHFLHQHWPKGGSKPRFQYSLTSGHSLEILAQTLPGAPWHHREQPVTMSIFFGIFKFNFRYMLQNNWVVRLLRMLGTGQSELRFTGAASRSLGTHEFGGALRIRGGFPRLPVPLFWVNARNDLLKTLYQFTAYFISSYSSFRRHLRKGNNKSLTCSSNR